MSKVPASGGSHAEFPVPRASTADPARAQRLASFLLRDVNAAIREFAMIRPGDRVAVAVSGGKDSLGLMSLLLRRRELGPEPYELAAIHVCLDATGITAAHGDLESWLAAQPGIRYRIVQPELPVSEALPLNCQRCTWLRRKALFVAAQELGCNVVAYAHHADDAAQTTLMSVIYNGSAHTLAPASDYFDGQFRLVRPLFYVPETELARLAVAEGFPTPPPLCPRAGQSRRLLARQMLQLLGKDYLRQGRTNLIRVGLHHIPGKALDSDVWDEARASRVRRPSGNTGSAEDVS